MKKLIVIVLVLAYIFCPVDLFPGIPLDDLAVIAVAILAMKHKANAQLRYEFKTGEKNMKKEVLFVIAAIIYCILPGDLLPLVPIDDIAFLATTIINLISKSRKQLSE